MRYRYKTAESVRMGHPDKVADIISDSVLTEALTLDPDSRVACETLITKGLVVVTGEISCKHKINYEQIINSTLDKIGYDSDSYTKIISITPQSEDIARGVDRSYDSTDETVLQGAGDQGTVYGYAINETDEYLPLPLILSHKICKKLDEDKKLTDRLGILPDGKAQVTVEYVEGKPTRVDSVVISVHHKSESNLEEIRRELSTDVIYPIMKDYLDSKTRIYINPAGPFITGGPDADAGLTGRKLMVDTYGGLARHGGGAFSGKDPSKVDRSAAYLARYLAKNAVSRGLASECEVGLSYAIGVARPVGLEINTFGTGDELEVERFIIKDYDLSPEGIVKMLNLKEVDYRKTAYHGHFSDNSYPWESIDEK